MDICNHAKELHGPPRVQNPGIERVALAGVTLFREGAAAVGLFRLREGWAFRYKMLADGRRQILNFLLPGDVIGLQASVGPRIEHGVETLTRVRLSRCTLDRLNEADGDAASCRALAALARHAAAQEQILDDQLLTVGRRTALERTAYLIWSLARRVNACGAGLAGTMEFPLTQQHLADCLGLSLVHTNKTLRRLIRTDCIALKGRRLAVKDERMLAEIASV
ncbi:Crp/Fnr family transcriptional regulator [Amorphus sp. MBR-141]